MRAYPEKKEREAYAPCEKTKKRSITADCECAGCLQRRDYAKRYQAAKRAAEGKVKRKPKPIGERWTWPKIGIVGFAGDGEGEGEAR